MVPGALFKNKYMMGLKRITIEDLRKCYVVVYTQEEVDQLSKLGVNAIITYINGGMCIMGKAVSFANDTVPNFLQHLNSPFSEQKDGNVKLVFTGTDLKKKLADEF